MLLLSENLKKFRVLKKLTQENIAEYLNVTPQSVSKWERGESYPDITFLPALANIFETNIDTLIGMDVIRSEETGYNIHKTANEYMRNREYKAAEKLYRDAMRIYPNKPGMMIGLAGVLSLQGNSEEAIILIEKGLPLSVNEKQKATARAVLCFLYLQCGSAKKAAALAATLPHMRESREIVEPLISAGMNNREIDKNIRYILLGE